MAARRKGPTPPRPWEPFVRAEGLVNRATGADYDPLPGEEVWINNRYVVILRRLTDVSDTLPALVHLSIRRQDRGTVRDWRDLQRIKNELVGIECEGVEIYPADSRLVDTSNQYHLWVFADPAFRLPFGFGDRLVMDADEAARVEPGATQRPLDRPAT